MAFFCSGIVTFYPESVVKVTGSILLFTDWLRKFA